MISLALRRVALALAGIAALAAPVQPLPARAAEPYEINVIVSLTGPFAFIGSAEAKSVQAIETIVNKKAASRVSRSR